MPKITRDRIDVGRANGFGVTSAGKMRIGDTFQITAVPDYGIETDAIHIKLNPTGFLLNSSVVQNALNARSCLVANLESGSVYFIDKDSLVIEATATLKATLHA